MKKNTFWASLVAVIAIMTFACKKTEFDNTLKGEALGTFRISSPSSGTSLILNSATPAEKIEISWTSARPGVSTQPTYKWIAALKTGGNLDQPLIEFPADNGGKATKLTLMQKQIDSLLSAKGIAANANTDLQWSIVADNGTTKTRSEDVFNISIKRMGDGVTPFRLFGPSSSTTNLEINPSSTTDSIRFNWERALPGVAANPVRYKVVFFNEGGSASSPLFSVTSRNNGADTTIALSWKQISDSLTAKGFTDPSQVAKLQWTAVATSGTFSMPSTFTNNLNIVRLVRMYLVGSINGWDINAPFEMIPDKKTDRNGKVFYTYIKMNAGDEFKFAKTPGDWSSAYGNTGTSGGGFTAAVNQGGNFQAITSGVYRLTLDAGINRVYVQQKQVGLVGAFQGWDAGNPTFGGMIARNKFLIITSMTNGDEFKFHDGLVWDNSTPDKARWWGKGATANTLDVDGNGANVANTIGTGRVRAIWDGTNLQTIKYDLSSAQEMRVVGDGIQGVNAWDPGTSPQMTYQGNGVWRITLSLVGGKDIKFLAGNAWGAYDYEDASGGSTAVGTARAITADGSNNFKTPATSGTYTITLNEYTQTVTIN